jgi:hypothetical protein
MTPILPIKTNANLRGVGLGSTAIIVTMVRAPIIITRDALDLVNITQHIPKKTVRTAHLLYFLGGALDKNQPV